MQRTHTCGELKLSDVNKNVLLQGWVAKVRKMGALAFLDLRDRYGITQIILDDKFLDLNLKNEFVIQVEGKVLERKSKNDTIPTGEIEIMASDIKIINESKLTPFEIKNNIESQEDTRLKYRYLDLRRPEMQEKLILRSKMNSIIRNYFIGENFIEIETPIFGKSTPEGARDFLVPSRTNSGKFYALPQSPQLYKQLFMISGLDRYFQIVKCFRDEDLRIDRQPEFTQLDMEMSFANQETVMNTIEMLMKKLVKDLKGVEIKEPIKRMTWKESFDKYGNDKPDLRFELPIKTVTDIFKNTDIEIYKNVFSNNKVIRAICVPELINKKSFETLTESAKQNGVNILGIAKYSQNEWSGSVGSKLNEDEKKSLLKLFNQKGDFTILLISDTYEIATKALGAVRMSLGKIMNLLDSNKFEFVWIVDFPLFEFSEEENRFVSAHHPFTMPAPESLENFDTDKASAKANAYDIVLNGFEIGGGSERITNEKIQQRMFKAIELSDKQVEENFGWFKNAYSYGAPNHAGCALGLDRICMLLTNSQNIREVIAFPKNSYGIDPMSGAPDTVSDGQLNELNIKTKTKNT